MQASNKIAVAGATGRVGRHVVDILNADGHDVVAMSRASGVDVVTGEGLADALSGVETIIDVASGPSPDQQEETEFFTAAARNLQEAGARAGVRRLVVVRSSGSIGSRQAITSRRSHTSEPCRRARSPYASCARRSSTSSSRRWWNGAIRTT